MRLDETDSPDEGAVEPLGTPHYLGSISRFSPGRGVGAVRSDSGREILFDLRFVRVAGIGAGERAARLLHEGVRIGFDVGWTSRGLRVTWIRPLEEADASER
ncbi:MAG: hypothetical protein FJ144_11285 [Deltaproteobacteria bacterium]|nr:hypothetical protein [Deltaproteobacteria bacterium]